MANQISFTGSLFISIYTPRMLLIYPYSLTFPISFSPLRMAFLQSMSSLGTFWLWSQSGTKCLAGRHLVASGNMFGMAGRCSWDAVGRGQENTVYSAHNMVAPHNKGLSGLE